MPLYVRPVQVEDFDTIIRHADVYEPGDDLVAPPNPVAWPVRTRTEAQRRPRFVMAKQKRRFTSDPTARFVKVVDAASSSDADASQSDIISVARWHYFPTGYDFATMSHWETAERLPGEETWPQALNRELHDYVLLSRDAARKDWIGQGKPVWILMHLVTRQSQRGRGAAGLLINWGIERSERDNIPLYLEAGAQGRPIYEKHGFQQVGDLRYLDLRPFGLDLTFELANMVRFPRGGRKEEKLGGRLEEAGRD